MPNSIDDDSSLPQTLLQKNLDLILRNKYQDFDNNFLLILLLFIHDMII